MRSRLTAILLLLSASACGRLGYDPRAFDGGLGDDDGAQVDAGDGVSVWEDFAGSGSGEGVSDAPGSSSLNGRLGIGPDGTIFVLYANDATGIKEIYLKRWTGTAWAGLGSSAMPGGLSNDSRRSSLGGVAFDSSGHPHVTWMDDDASRSIYYRHWDGAAWVEKFGSASGRGLSVSANPYWPKIAISPTTGEPIIAYEVYTVLPNGGAIHLKTATVADWQGIAGSATNEGVSDAAGSARHVNLAVEGDKIYVAWQETRPAGIDIYVSVYSPQGGWQGLGTSLDAGGISRSASESQRPTIRVQNGTVIVSWTEAMPEGDRAYLRAFQNGQWEELAGSASGDGVSASFSPAKNVSFELDAQGRPFAAWSHDADGDSDIFGARWTGTEWVYPEFEKGSISASTGSSDYPRVAIDTNGRVFVLWEETLASSEVAIYLRSEL